MPTCQIQLHLCKFERLHFWSESKAAQNWVNFMTVYERTKLSHFETTLVTLCLKTHRHPTCNTTTNKRTHFSLVSHFNHHSLSPRFLSSQSGSNFSSSFHFVLLSHFPSLLSRDPRHNTKQAERLLVGNRSPERKPLTFALRSCMRTAFSLLVAVYGGFSSRPAGQGKLALAVFHTIPGSAPPWSLRRFSTALHSLYFGPGRITRLWKNLREFSCLYALLMWSEWVFVKHKKKNLSRSRLGRKSKQRRLEKFLQNIYRIWCR